MNKRPELIISVTAIRPSLTYSGMSKLWTVDIRVEDAESNETISVFESVFTAIKKESCEMFIAEYLTKIAIAARKE